jgi:hypothetical protein
MPMVHDTARKHRKRFAINKGIIYQSQNCEVIRKDQENQTYSTWLFTKMVTEAVPGVFS